VSLVGIVGEKPFKPKVDRMLVDKLRALEEKWVKRWLEDKIFEADPDPSKPKFFVTFPYPYINGLTHLGSAFTILRVDIAARYKRMRGFNVLFAQGWHATGGPIVSASLRVREGDKKIISDLLSMGVPEVEIQKFAKPEYWVEYFAEKWKRDLINYGLSIDWRREFFTTYLNPYYSKFIEWQYLKLRERGFIATGTHPVVWCSKELKVVGDHDRPDEYVGVSFVDAVIIKFKLDDGRFIPTLTFRPETIYGVTNIWVHPEAEYVIADVDDETWILSGYMAEELKDQGHKVVVKGVISGLELIGRRVYNPVTNVWIPILPAWFVDPELGSGIVMSVPAHAPYDYAALEDLKSNPDLALKYNIDPKMISELKPIPLIKLEGYSEIPARDAVLRRGVKSQNDRGNLDAATSEIYSKEYYMGVLLSNTGVWAGRIVFEVKDEIINWLESKGYAIKVYTLPIRVYCRCGARTHVKIVSNQWFLLYSNPEWKNSAIKWIDQMNLYPEEIREELKKTVMNLRDWAFTHKGELGTRLPWDPEWVIESLSDSTIYMAYYPLAKYLQHPEIYGIKPEQLKPEFFDYVLLGIGEASKVSKSTGIPVDLLESIKSEFLYWYPVDLRISGKDLLYNHLVFFLLHHIAIFPRDLWPRGISINGWIMVAGEKMSKSKGNFILLRDAIENWSASAVRWAEVMAGADSTLEDPNFEPSVADLAVNEIFGWINFACKNYGSGRLEKLRIDEWFESVLNRIIKRTTELMDKTMYKSAFVEGYYNLQNKFKWYLRRTETPNRDLLKKFIEVQTLILAPFIPHVADEIWERIGKSGYASMHPWPECDESKIKPEIELAEEIVIKVLEDCRELIRLLKQAKTIRITTASKWKYDFAFEIKRNLECGVKLSDAIRDAIRKMQIDIKNLSYISQNIAKNPEILDLLVPAEIEYNTLKEAEAFLSKELNVKVIVENEDEGISPRKSSALPGRPAIYIEK